VVALDVATRTCDGVAITKESGKRFLVCGRCHAYFPDRASAIAVYRDGDIFLYPPDAGFHRWNKQHGVYSVIRDSRESSKHPAAGSRIKCLTCQWVNTVPEDDA
jgi:hypothetical protein